jgi:antitoxin VapB
MIPLIDMKSAESGIAKVFMHGRSQAVRLPKEFRLKADRVRVRRVEGGKLLLEPMFKDFDEWHAAVARLADPNFMAEGRNQPPMPPPKDIFD